MDFAKKQLEKYGWQEGKGLGKSENGITTAIKPKLKFDNAGIGHDSSEQFTNNWWEKLYNNAANNVNVSTAANGNVQVNVSDPDGVEITTKNYSLKNLKKNNSSGLEYGTFRKTSKLTENGIVDLDNNYCDVPTYSNTKTDLCPLTDEELFAACGGRTAHKGARHGLTLNGKLSRLEKQEKLLLKRLRKVSISDETETKDCKENLEKKLRKINDHRDKHSTDSMEEGMIDSPIGTQITVGFSSPHKNSKNRKKERKRVSFSETVTEYQTQEVDSVVVDNHTQDLDSGSLSDCNSRPSTPVTTVRTVEIKDKTESPSNNSDVLTPDQDEGIESDSTSSQLYAKIKEENYKMKRKLRKLRKKYAAESSKKNLKYNCNEDEALKDSGNCVKCTKRKIIIEDDFHDRDSKRHCDDYDDEIELNLNCSEEQPKTKKERKKLQKKQKRLEKRINRVADSLNELCKISDIESE
ncbi:hypothetical protein ILUMI_17398 [Ignelater luminosus]|uniref:G patch domain-containing protein 4 n=1 Tax=Ignelater luminosus TaxID=2038154 RepID=A0A8K0CSD8_IGNLU|nr:hypothetical protein ILUMI_17398 [Ignelater luminosus]